MAGEKVDYIGEIEKQPGEKRPLSVDFTDKLPAGVTLSTCTVAAVELPSDTTASVLSGSTASVVGNVASIFVQSGADKTRYRVTFTATLSDSSVLVEDVLMRVASI